MFSPCRSFTRRQLVKAGALTAAGTTFAALPRIAGAMAPTANTISDADGILFKALALGAVDAAKSAGAAYADVRLTRTMRLSYVIGGFNEKQELAVGVRALADGAWGFAAGPYWTAEEMQRLAREAVAQARINARGAATKVEWPPIPIATGSWTTPIVTDPFSVSYDEMLDTLAGLYMDPRDHWHGKRGVAMWAFEKIEKTQASTDGALFTQTIYRTDGSYTVDGDSSDGSPDGKVTKEFPLASAGWEYITEAKLFDAIPAMIEEALRVAKMPAAPVEPGQYDVVFAAPVVASLLGETLGIATQLDRALGYEANAGGTSYLNDPDAMTGVAQVAAPLVTITADRTMPRGAATVRWDDDGVQPQPFTLVRDGVLADYQKTREFGSTTQGCAEAPSAMFIPMQHTPNLTLAAGREDLSFEQLVARTRRGVAVVAGRVETDFQARNGSVGGVIREIRDGKLGPRLRNAGILFGTANLWKNVMALGGAGSVQRTARRGVKGEPNQMCFYSLDAVPMQVKNVAVIDAMRRI